MNDNHHIKYIVMILMLLLSQISQAEANKNENMGAEDYINNCAVCHGVDGKGNGPQANKLSSRPTDLTLLSKKNGGSFPEIFVYNIIDGREAGDIHGSEMPIWGEYFLDIEEEGEEVIDARISRILKYVESIQVD
jgi:mono/diheme cytochrome c family protein